jgi:hypothetical protein
MKLGDLPNHQTRIGSFAREHNPTITPTIIFE